MRVNHGKLLIGKSSDLTALIKVPVWITIYLKIHVLTERPYLSNELVLTHFCMNVQLTPLCEHDRNFSKKNVKSDYIYHIVVTLNDPCTSDRTGLIHSTHEEFSNALRKHRSSSEVEPPNVSLRSTKIILLNTEIYKEHYIIYFNLNTQLIGLQRASRKAQFHSQNDWKIKLKV